MIERPAFREGTINLNFKADRIPENKREGLGNRLIQRKGFKLEPPPPRLIPDWDSIVYSYPLSDQNRHTIPEPLETFLEIDIPDDDDTSWLEEKERLTTEFKRQGMSDSEIKRRLKYDKPLGREQRKIRVSRGVATKSILSMEEKLVEIAEEIVNGNVESRFKQDQFIGFLRQILNKQIVREDEEKKLLDPIIDRLNISSDPRQLGIDFRYINGEYFNENVGNIQLFLLSQARKNIHKKLSLDKPVLGLTGNPINMDTMIRNLRKSTKTPVWLDIYDSKLIDHNDVKILLKEGVDTNIFSGVSLSSPKRSRLE